MQRSKFERFHYGLVVNRHHTGCRQMPGNETRIARHAIDMPAGFRITVMHHVVRRL